MDLFLLDVNDYQMKRIEELRNIARMSAQRVIFFKKELEMEPMTAYDRRIIHSVLGGLSGHKNGKASGKVLTEGWL